MDPRAPLCDLVAPMAGYRVGVTADRRAEEQGELLRRMGAEVHPRPGPADAAAGRRPADARGAPSALLADPPTIVLLTTGNRGALVGRAPPRRWGARRRAARPARTQRRSAPVVRRPTPRPCSSASRSRTGSRPSGSSAMVAQLTRRAAGRGSTSRCSSTATTCRGPRRRCGRPAPGHLRCRCTGGSRPDDEGPARRLVREAIEGQLTGDDLHLPVRGREHLPHRRAPTASLDELLAAFRTRVAVACVGPVTAGRRDGPWRARGLRAQRRPARAARALAGGDAPGPATCTCDAERPRVVAAGRVPRGRRRRAGRRCRTGSARCSRPSPGVPAWSCPVPRSSARSGGPPTRTGPSTPCSPGSGATSRPPGSHRHPCPSRLPAGRPSRRLRRERGARRPAS